MAARRTALQRGLIALSLTWRSELPNFCPSPLYTYAEAIPFIGRWKIVAGPIPRTATSFLLFLTLRRLNRDLPRSRWLTDGGDRQLGGDDRQLGGEDRRAGRGGRNGTAAVASSAAAMARSVAAPANPAARVARSTATVASPPAATDTRWREPPTRRRRSRIRQRSPPARWRWWPGRLPRQPTR